MQTTTVEVFQNGGADKALEAAKEKFLASNPGAQVTDIAFEYAYPGRPGEGRYVGIKVTFTK